MLFSTTERLATVLNRSMMYAHASSVYDGVDPLFVNAIKNDILFELNSIEKSPIRKDSAFEYVFPESHKALDLVADKDVILEACRFLLNVNIAPPQASARVVQLLTAMPYNSPYVTNWFVARYKYFVNRASILHSLPVEDFYVANVGLPTIHRRGFELSLDFGPRSTERFTLSDGTVHTFSANDLQQASFEFSNAKYLQDKWPGEFMKYQACIVTPNMSMDMQFRYLACSVYEHDINMLFGDTVARTDKWRDTFAFNDMVYRVYTRNTVARIANELLSYRLSYLDQHLNNSRNAERYLAAIVAVYSRFRIPLGACTEKIMLLLDKAYTSSPRDANNVASVITYIRTVLTSNKPEAEITEEQQEAYTSSEYYLASLDVKSPLFIGAEAVKDDLDPSKITLGEDDIGDEDDDDENTDDDDDDTDEDEDTDEENDEDEVSPEEDDFVMPEMEAGEENPPPNDTEVSEDPLPEGASDINVTAAPPTISTNDKSGYSLTLPTTGSSLDNYLYLQEVEFIISTLLKNPPESISTEDLSILRRLKSHWLFILSIETVHEIVTKIVKLPIKLKLNDE
jgi:hypothetical protein